MQAHGFVHFPQSLIKPLLACAAGALLAACGNTTVNVGGGSSSGGTSGMLAGTFTKNGASTRGFGSDKVFGAVDTVGNGYFADLGGTSRAVFVFGSASSSGQLNGSFMAYAANGSNLGNGTTLQQGTLGGTVTSSSGITTASVKYNANSTVFDTATLVLDHPVLGQTPLTTVKGTYTVSTGAAAITSSSLATSGTYTATITSSGGFGITSTAGCNLQNSSTATLDSTYNIYDLHVSGTCPGTSGTITLDGLAVYVPAGNTSPLDGSVLTTDILVVELSDFIATGGLNKALVLVAPRSS